MAHVCHDSLIAHVHTRIVFHRVLIFAYRFSQLQIGWHSILTLFLKTFNLVPGVPGFSWDSSFITWYYSQIPWAEFRFVENVLKIISRFSATLSAIGCTYSYVCHDSRHMCAMTHSWHIFTPALCSIVFSSLPAGTHSYVCHDSGTAHIHTQIMCRDILNSYGVALVSRIEKIIGLFCKRAL